MKELIRLIALVEDIESTLFHYNHSIDGWHLSGETEPIMNFVADFDMEALTEAKQTLQALTSVKSEQTNVIVRDNISEEPSVKFEINANPENGIVFYADSVKGNGLHFDSPSVKSEIAEDKKQHEIWFATWLYNQGDIYGKSKDELYNEYLTTLNNK